MGKKSRRFKQLKFDKELEINKEKAQEGIHELILVLDHLKGNFNIGKILRSAEIFSIKEIHIVGTKFFDPTPGKGALKRLKVFFYDDFKESVQRVNQQGFTPVTFDSKAETYLNTIELPKKSAFIFGHEEFGPLYETEHYPNIKKVKIRQYGLTESFNVSVAASLAMYEYTNQHAL